MAVHMKISPNYSTRDWRILDLTLGSTEEDWRTGIEIFQDRIKGRYFDYMDQIEGGIYSGFAVMALSCLLIETLQQFFEGVARTPYGKSEEYFIRFLTETSFGEYFDRDRAKRFYKQIRCGILHQAEVETISLIRIGRNRQLVEDVGDNKGLIINRRKFYAKLKKVFDNYTARLTNSSDTEIREKFIYKMNYICRIYTQE